MELSSKIKGLKFMRKKEDSLLKKKENQELGEVVNNSMWKQSSSSGNTKGETRKPRFTVEYDYSHKGRSSSSYSAKKATETELDYIIREAASKRPLPEE